MTNYQPNQPPGQQYWQGFPPGPPMPPPKKPGMGTGKKVLLVIGSMFGGLIFLGLIVAAAGGGKSTGESTGKTTEAAGTSKAEQDKPKRAAAPGIGDKAKDGKFTFTVTKTGTATSISDNEFLDRKPQGEYFVVTVKVSNHGDDARTLDASSQKLISADGRSTRPRTRSPPTARSWRTSIRGTR